MRQEIRTIDRLVQQAVENGDFPSEDAWASAVLNWLVLNEYINPSRLDHPKAKTEDSRKEESIDERHTSGLSEAEETLLQYEILRDRDA